MRKAKVVIHRASLANERLRTHMPYPRAQRMARLREISGLIVFAPQKLASPVGFLAGGVFGAILKAISVENLMVHLSVAHSSPPYDPAVANVVVGIAGFGYELKSAPPVFDPLLAFCIPVAPQEELIVHHAVFQV